MSRHDEPSAQLRRVGTARRRSRSRGQSLVELALALPILLLLVLGTVDLGRAFFDYIQMRNGAFEGARYGARLPSDNAGITAAVTTHGVPSGSSVSVSTSGDCATIGGNCTVTVTVTHTFKPISTSFLNHYFGLGNIDLHASATVKGMT